MANNSPDTQHTNGQRPNQPHWRPLLTGLAAAAGIVLTVIAAFVLALQDLPVSIQLPLPPPMVVQPTPDTPTPSPTFTPLPSPTSIPTSAPVEPAPTPTTRVPTLPPPTSTPIKVPTVIPEVCRPPAGWVPHPVQSGETLALLAYHYNTNVSKLMEANCLFNDTIYPGQVVYVPPPVPSATPRPTCGPPPSNWVQYTVQPGDTLYSLAVRTQTTVYAIVQANCLNSYEIYVGQRLWLPYIPPTATFTPTRPPTATWTPTATATPVVDTPTPTPSPTTGVNTPTPTITSEPTQTPSPTPTSEPPTATPTPPSPTPTSGPPTSTATQPPPTNTPVPFPTPGTGG